MQINEIFRNMLNKFQCRISSTRISSTLQRLLLFKKRRKKKVRAHESASRKTVINLMDFWETRQIATWRKEGNINGVISRSRRSHISCNSPPTPPDCISIVHSAMSRVIRKLRLPDYAERRDLRSLPGGLIDTDTSGNLKCVHVKVQPPLPSSPTFPGASAFSR